MRTIPIPLTPFNMVKSFAIQDKKVILIDTGLPGDGEKILAFLAKEKIDIKDISLILLTHSHADHTGSAKYLKEKLNVPVAIHREEAEDLATGFKRPYTPTGFAGQLWQHTPPAKAGFEEVTPDIILEDEMSLKEWGINGKVIHTPGHTAGSVSVLLENGDLIAGDLLAGGVFVGGIANYQRPILPPFQEDLALTKISVQKVLDLVPKNFHVCHGGPLAISQVSKMIATL